MKQSLQQFLKVTQLQEKRVFISRPAKVRRSLETKKEEKKSCHDGYQGFGKIWSVSKLDSGIRLSERNGTYSVICEKAIKATFTLYSPEEYEGVLLQKLNGKYDFLCMEYFDVARNLANSPRKAGMILDQESKLVILENLSEAEAEEYFELHEKR